jgi:ABC-2 type transport system ATP-binding protein
MRTRSVASAFASVRFVCCHGGDFMEDSIAEAPLPNPQPRATPERPVVLEVRGLQRHFGKVPAVDGVDLTVNEGEIYGFLGVNGAGKTTTIRLLMGIIAAEAGTISLLGETTRRTSVAQKRRIGYVSQEQHFYPWMSGDALGKFVGSFYPTWDKDEFARLLRVLEVPHDRRVSQLSGGMRAKLALALALASRPALLILDEPTAGLDPVARREFMQLIVAQARQHRRTTLFSSHLIDEVERCADRVGIIHQGQMRFEGGLDELRQRVRRIQMPAELAFDIPPGFERWREQVIEGWRTIVLRAEPEDWTALQLPEGIVPEMLSLEDIFIACVGSRIVEV